jgi:putative transposase
MRNPFKFYNSSPEVIRLKVLMYVKYPLSLRNVEDLLAERGIEICHETVRQWWNKFGPMFAAEIKRQRVLAMHFMQNGREECIRLKPSDIFLADVGDEHGAAELRSFLAEVRPCLGTVRLAIATEALANACRHANPTGLIHRYYAEALSG